MKKYGESLYANLPDIETLNRTIKKEIGSMIKSDNAFLKYGRKQMRQLYKSAFTIPPEFIQQFSTNIRLMAAEKAVHLASCKLKRLKDPKKKAKLIWRLAYIDLHDLEDIRPAGGFES